MRAPGVAKSLVLVLASLGFGSLVSISVYRFLVLDQVQAQDRNHSGRMTAIENEASISRARIDTLFRRANSTDSVASFTIKDICARYTPYDQRWLGVSCDPNIFKGAPR